MKANFVLIQDGLEYFVMKRRFTKKEYSTWEHFVSFHETLENAYDKAILLTKNRMKWNEDRILRFKKQKRKKEIYA